MAEAELNQAVPVGIPPVPAVGRQLHVAGVALGRFTLRDGRRADSPHEAAEMVANFSPGTVPILSRHSNEGGVVVGWLDTLRADEADLHFTGHVMDDPDLIERLRTWGVSIEVVYAYARWDGQPRREGVALATQAPYYRGRLGYGKNLIGVALTRTPATGSVMWPVESS